MRTTALDARPLLGFLAAVTLALVTTNVVAKLVYDPMTDRNFWTGNFDVNGEANAPTMWNASLLLLIAMSCVALCAVQGRVADRPDSRLGWIAAALVVSFMAADELLRWHEKLRGVGSRLSSGVGVALPTYAWLLPGAFLAVGLAVLVWLWVRRLPDRHRSGVLLGAGMYLTGALGAEAVSGWIEGAHGVGLAYNLVTALEEGLEMAGCIVVLGALVGLFRVTHDRHGRRAVTVVDELLPAGASVPPHHGTDAPPADGPSTRP